MDRHKDILWSSFSKKKDITRTDWATYDNIKKMYDLIYPELVDCGIAVKVQNDLFFDVNGNEVDSETQIFGLPTKYQMVIPGNLIMVDECGSNTNMKKDSRQGGKRGIAEINQPAYIDASTSDFHYTVMGFTASTGEPVMCAIIVKGEEDAKIPYDWQLGLDVRKLKKVNDICPDIVAKRCPVFLAHHLMQVLLPTSWLQ
jgi:hypothetical protein